MQEIVFPYSYCYILHPSSDLYRYHSNEQSQNCLPLRTMWNFDHPKWAGQCSECGEWNSLLEVTLAPATTHRAQPKMGGGYAGQAATITTLNKVSVSHETRLATGIGEFDRVLGGGLVTGSVVLIGGDPGIGKSTILLQTATHMAAAQVLHSM